VVEESLTMSFFIYLLFNDWIFILKVSCFKYYPLLLGINIKFPAHFKPIKIQVQATEADKRYQFQFLISPGETGPADKNRICFN